MCHLWILIITEVENIPWRCVQNKIDQKWCKLLHCTLLTLAWISLNGQLQNILNNGITFFYFSQSETTKVLNTIFMLRVQAIISQSLNFSILWKLRLKPTSFPRSNTSNLQLVPPPKIAPILFPMRIFEKLQCLYTTTF